MKIYVDLHIHSALSPCAHDDMTPCNIINMAYLKGLDAVSITDHNCVLNAMAAECLASERGILLIPGMEIQTREEFHSLCYFKDFKTLSLFWGIVGDKLPNIKNKPQLFGKQEIYDSQDEKIGEFDRLLLNSIDMSYSELCKVVDNLGGVVVPAHVNKGSFSIINSLGFIPEEENVNTIEIFGEKEYNIQEKPFVTKKYNEIYSSDAHYLEDISERKNSIEVEEKSVKGIINFLKYNKNN